MLSSALTFEDSGKARKLLLIMGKKTQEVKQLMTNISNAALLSDSEGNTNKKLKTE